MLKHNKKSTQYQVIHTKMFIRYLKFQLTAQPGQVSSNPIRLYCENSNPSFTVVGMLDPDLQPFQTALSSDLVFIIILNCHNYTSVLIVLQ